MGATAAGEQLVSTTPPQITLTSDEVYWSDTTEYLQETRRTVSPYMTRRIVSPYMSVCTHFNLLVVVS